MSETVERFGDYNLPAYQRGEITPAEPGERMVDMECCAFRFSAVHTDTDREGYTCPCCTPRGAILEAAEAVYRLAIAWPGQMPPGMPGAVERLYAACGQQPPVLRAESVPASRGVQSGETVETTDERLLAAYVAGCNAESELRDAEVSPENVRRGVAAAMRKALGEGV